MDSYCNRLLLFATHNTHYISLPIVIHSNFAQHLAIFLLGLMYVHLHVHVGLSTTQTSIVIKNCTIVLSYVILSNEGLE